MPNIHLKIVTPDRILLEEDVSKLTVPTKAGEITILPNHSNLISEISHGDIVATNGKEEKISLVYGGFIEISEDSNVIILADSAEHLHEVNEKEAEEARKRAEESLKGIRDDHERFAEAQALLAKNLTRLNALKKHRSKKILNCRQKSITF